MPFARLLRMFPTHPKRKQGSEGMPASRQANRRRSARGRRRQSPLRVGAGFEGLEDRRMLSFSPAATLVADINPGAASSNPSSPAVLNGDLLFAATDPTYGTELWTSDGTTNGTHLVKDINPTTNVNPLTGNPTPNSSFPSDLVTVGGSVYFSATDGTDGIQLWKTDGTANGTVMVTDLNVAGGGMIPTDLTNVNGTLFFVGNDGVHGAQVWESDGTSTGTTLVSDIQPTTGVANPANLTNVNGTLFFTANTTTNPTTNPTTTSNTTSNTTSTGVQLWKTNGIPIDTQLVLNNVVQGGNGANPTDLTNVDGILYFAATDGGDGNELWRSDGTSTGTFMVADINPGLPSSNPANLRNVNGTLFFTANDGTNGVQLWKSDGTTAGTTMVANLGGVAVPADLTNVNGVLFFRANDGTHGMELWRSDGTTAGTTLVSDINAGQAGSLPDNLTNANGTLFFTANDGIHGVKLWESDGTAAGTVQVPDAGGSVLNTNPGNLIVAGQMLFFTAGDAAHGSELWDTALPAEARPVADNASYTFSAGTPLNVTPPGVLTGNPAGGGPYTMSVVTTTANGSLTLNPDGSFTYVPNAGFDGKDSFTFTVTNATGTSLLSGTVTLASQDFRWVQSLYVDLLQRPAGATSDADVMYWVDQLAAGMTREQIATAFINSTEYRAGLINNDYELYLGRPVDAGTLTFWLEEMNQGLTSTGLIQQILSSDEFFLRNGTAGFVDSLYQDLLGRTPTLAEAGYWKQQLYDDGVARSTIVAAFLSSGEYDVVVTQTLYQRLLGRPTDAGAVSFWLAQFQAGSTAQDVEVALVASGEFYNSGAVTASGAPSAPLMVY
ncbi:MAG TPA: ELWxxDGT repeat protein [Pirellulales bacterium]|nr:ELWxxDGT repeat protein [Pirellulales bacterium]